MRTFSVGYTGLLVRGFSLTFHNKETILNFHYRLLLPKPSKVGKIMAQPLIKGYYSTYFGGPGMVT